ncbi:hypothetical protein MMC28_008120 [Mycoblastus sanguinarius]|nr:hypothetical protein [Mycoblastus sanguinarius]
MPVDFATDLLLLTCANGKQCQHLIPFLLPKWKSLRLVVNSESSRQKLLENYASNSKSNIEVVQADLAQPDDCKRILEGVRAVFHVGPAFHPRETEIGSNMISASLTKNPRPCHFIYSSVLHPSLRKLLNHDSKRPIEETLIESSLPYTILQPSHFMDMFPIAHLASQDQPVYTARWEPDVPF